MATALSALERAARAAFSTYTDIEGGGNRLEWDDLHDSAKWAWMAVASATVKAYEGGGK